MMGIFGGHLAWRTASRWREVLAIFLEAARGLGAIHRADWCIATSNRTTCCSDPTAAIRIATSG